MPVSLPPDSFRMVGVVFDCGFIEGLLETIAG